MYHLAFDNNGKVITETKNGEKMYGVSWLEGKTFIVQAVPKSWILENAILITNINISRDGKIIRCKDKKEVFYDGLVKMIKEAMRSSVGFSPERAAVSRKYVKVDKQGRFITDKSKYEKGHTKHLIDQLEAGKISFNGADGDSVQQLYGLMALWGLNFKHYFNSAYFDALSKETESGRELGLCIDNKLKEHIIYSRADMHSLIELSKKDPERYTFITFDASAIRLNQHFYETIMGNFR